MTCNSNIKKVCNKLYLANLQPLQEIDADNRGILQQNAYHPQFCKLFDTRQTKQEVNGKCTESF